MIAITRMTKKQSSQCRRCSSTPPNPFQLLLMLSMVMALMQNSATVLSFSPSLSSCGPSSLMLPLSKSFQSQLGVSASDDIVNDDDDKERVLARVRRRRGRGAYADDDDADNDDSVSDSGSRKSRRGDESVNYAADILEDDGIFDEMDDEYYDDDDIENDESYDTFSNTVIPNQLLDSIDPDGSADRFSELASDPRFWFDIFLFITILDFISFIGPRNPFLDVVPEMYTAGLPPPGI